MFAAVFALIYLSDLFNMNLIIVNLLYFAVGACFVVLVSHAISEFRTKKGQSSLLTNVDEAREYISNENILLNKFDWGSVQRSDENSEKKDAFENLTEVTEYAHASRNLYEIAARRFEELFAGVPVACFTCDRSGTIFEWNRCAEELWGVPVYDILHKKLHPVVCTPESEELVGNLLARVFEGEVAEQLEIQTKNVTGKLLWAFVYVFPLRSHDGNITGAVWAFVDNTERKKQADLVSESEARFRNCIEWMQNGVLVLEHDGSVSICNLRAAETLGWSVATIRSKTFRFEHLCPVRQNDEAVAVENCPVTLSLRDGKTFRDEILGLKREDGSTVWVSLNSSPIIGSDGNSRIVISFVDITQDLENKKTIENHMGVISEYSLQLEDQTKALARANKMLSEMASTDGLTGLKNHRSFQEFLEKEFQFAKRHNTALSIIILDVDHFKQFNDTFGHPAGDEVLIEVGKLLESCARISDMVARYGGEEFVMVLPSSEREGVMVVAERIRLVIQDANWSERQITVSLGCSTMDLNTVDRSELTRAADEALYSAKRNGRNQLVHCATKKKAS